MTLVDTNVVIDVFDRDAAWYDWSLDRLAAAGVDGACVNIMVVAELSRNFEHVAALTNKLGQMSLTVEPMDERSAFLAGKRFQQFRRERTGAEDARVLPDFLIGAHALTLDVPLLTRDPRLYRRYFPELTLITPDTHP